eukprot:SAG31_NODE_532_length_14374_cov_30.565254_7_plen_89_part_00
MQGAFPNISLENNPEALAQAVAAHRDSSDAKTWEGARPTELEARGQTAFNGKGCDFRQIYFASRNLLSIADLGTHFLVEQQGEAGANI